MQQGRGDRRSPCCLSAHVGRMVGGNGKSLSWDYDDYVCCNDLLGDQPVAPTIFIVIV